MKMKMKMKMRASLAVIALLCATATAVCPRDTQMLDGGACVCKPGLLNGEDGGCDLPATIETMDAGAAVDKLSDVQISGRSVKFQHWNADTKMVEGVTVAELLELKDDELAGRVDDLENDVLNVTGQVHMDSRTLKELKVETEEDLASSRNRLNFLEDNIFSALAFESLIGNGNFENGQNVDGFNEEGSSGPYTIVPLPDDLKPPNGASFALQFSPSIGAISEYEIDWNGDNTHPLCPGTYRISAFARYESGYDGAKQLLHARFFHDGTSTAISPQGAASGAWPTQPDQWEPIEASITLAVKATSFKLYLGYPIKSTVGNVWVTGISMKRLGPVGSCDNEDERLPSLVDDVANLQQADIDAKTHRDNIENMVTGIIPELELLKNETNERAVVMADRVDNIENDLYFIESQASLVPNGDFADGLNAGGFKSGNSRGNFEIVELDPSDSPVASGYALKFNPEGANVVQEYEIHWDDTDTHPKCPGTYRISAFMKYSADFNGRQLLLHANAWYVGGGFATTVPEGPESGGWATRPDEWQKVEGFLTAEKEVTTFALFLGWPMKMSTGNVWVTGVRLVRLGVAGTCTAQDPLIPTLQEQVNHVETQLEEQIETTQGFVNASTINLLSLDLRMNFLENEYLKDRTDGFLNNRDFTDADGQPADISGHDAVGSYGNHRYVNIEDNPPPSLTKPKHALEFFDSNGGGAEYQITLYGLCPGTYRLSLWMYVSSDVTDVEQQIFHARGFEGGNGNANVAISPIGPTSGGWVTATDEWQYLEVDILFTNTPSRFEWYVGYPMRLKGGFIRVTDLQMQRLQGPCTSRRSVDDERLQQTVVKQQQELDALKSKMSEQEQRIQKLMDMLEDQA